MIARIFIIITANHSATNNARENRSLVKQYQITIFTRVSTWDAHLILRSQRGWGWGAYSREALFLERRSLNLSKSNQNTCLFNQTVRTVIITKE